MKHEMREAMRRSDEMAERLNRRISIQSAIITRLTGENLIMLAALEAIAKGKADVPLEKLAATALADAETLRRMAAAAEPSTERSDVPQDNQPEE